MLAQFRQLSQCFGRTLLGMLLFVWLTMALAPCVMASADPLSELLSELEPARADVTIEMSAMHEKMQNCAYCPEAENAMNSMVLCQNSHANISDTMNFVFDGIDVESLVLFEIPASIEKAPLLLSYNKANFHQSPDNYTLSPLALTGILRI